MNRKKFFSLFALLIVATAGIGAQTPANALPAKVNVGKATITEMGHATMCVKQQLIVDSTTMRVDTLRTVEKVEWNTDQGTAKARMAAQQRRKIGGNGSDFYDKDSNWWWDMWWFVYNYPSVNGRGEPIVLSGLVCMPDDDITQLQNLVIGCHATITANRECPSMNSHNGIGDTNDTDFFMLHASSGMVDHASGDDMGYYNLVIIPDYEGYGITQGLPHPYLSEELTARQVVDGVRYGLALYQSSDKVKKVRHPFRNGWRSFSVGYSQGGGTSMAVHRFIEQNNLVDELNFSGSICGAGPYNPMSTIMFYMDRARRNETMAMAVVMPLILKGMCDSNPYMRNHQLSDYLSERFLETGVADWLASKNYSTSDVKKEWNKQREEGKYGDTDYFKSVVEKDGAAYLSRIMTDDAYNYFLQVLDDNDNNIPDGYFIDPLSYSGIGVLTSYDYNVYAVDPAKPKRRGVVEDLQHALSYNDLTKGWNPEHPLYLYHSYKDDVVPTSNRVSAGNAFGKWVQKKDPAFQLDHVNTAVEFLLGTEERAAIRTLSKADLHPAAKQLGDAERIYKGTVQTFLTVGNRSYTIDTPAEYVLRKNADGQTVAILGSGYNACISQYYSGDVIVPATVEIDGTSYPVGGVNDMAFRMCTGVTRVTLPEGVKRVGDFAFYACRGLLEVDLPSTLQTIGTGAFIDLPNLQSVICRAVTPPVWEYNDVFCFHEDGIGDPRTYTTDNIMLWVADDHEEDYKQASYTNEELGWTTPDGWTYFGHNVRSVSDRKSESYAVYDDGTLTFYHDGRKQTRKNSGKRVFDLNGSNPDVPDEFPGWTDDTDGTAPTSSSDRENHAKDITRVVFSPSFFFARPVTTAKWFAGCENLETIEGWEYLNTSEVLSASFMFSECKSLRDDDVDLSRFVTPKCQSFMYMFKGCEGLTTLDLSHFDTSSATTMSSMFEGCTNLTHVNLNSFDTQNVTEFSGMFYGCSSLESLQLEKLSISNRASVDGFFIGCSSLQTLVLPFEIANAEGMFGGLTSMRDVYYYGVTPFSGWATRETDFMPNRRTRFHVLPTALDAWLEAWPNYPVDASGYYANVTYVADLLTEQCPFEIYTPFQWEMLDHYLQTDVTDIHAKLMADISVTTMVGSEAYPFSGIFDGMGHTITCQLSSDDVTAPFRAIGGADIKNLHVSGTISGKRHTAGIVGSCVNGMGSNTITNCLVDADITCNSLVGGIVGHGHSCSNTVTGCLSRSEIILDVNNKDSYPYAAGIIAWCDDISKQTVSDCLDLNSYLYYADGHTALNFGSSSAGVTPFKGTNSYFCSSNGIESDGIDYGVQIQSADEAVKLHYPGTSVSYDVSGITAYESGLVVYNSLIGGMGQTVPVAFDAPNGYRIRSVNYCTYNQGIATAGDALQQDADGSYLADLTGSSLFAPTYLLPTLELGTLLIDNDADNSTAIAALDSVTLDVQLLGRTLYKDGSWNTLSLPFSLTEEQLAESPLAGCTLATLSDVAFAGGILTLTFNDTTAISADRSYLIRWESAADDITDPVFYDVTISRANPAAIKFWLAKEVKAIGFKGTYSRIDFDDEDRTILFLGADNKLYYPDGSAQTYIGACRAYFDLYGLTANELRRNAQSYVLKFNESTGINTLTRSNSVDAWYDLSGRRVQRTTAQSDAFETQWRKNNVTKYQSNKVPSLPKGIYISNGKKVVIK